MAVADTGSDLEADASNDFWITFGFTLSSLQDFAWNALGETIDGSSINLLYTFTSTSQTANGDIGGVDDGTADLTASWSSLGVVVDQSLDTVSTIGASDTTPPAAPTVTAKTTNNSAPTITGTFEDTDGTLTSVVVNGKTYTPGDGNLSVSGETWSLTIPAGDALGEGTYSVTATATDAAGNVATDATSSELVIDTTAPNTGTIDITSAKDGGADDTLTNNGNPAVNFAGEAGLTVTLKGADGNVLAADQYAVSHDPETGIYTVTLVDGKPGSGTEADPFGTYASGSETGNPAGSADGTYTIVAADAATNTADVGTFEIDTGVDTGLLDITDETDTGADDLNTGNGRTALEFTGEAGLTLALAGPNGVVLEQGAHYSVGYAAGVYTVTLLDARPGGYINPFGSYYRGAATGNAASVADGTYALTATDLAGSSEAVGSFVIDTTGPVAGPIDLTAATDTGLEDDRTGSGLPVITFSGEAGLTIVLKGANGTVLTPDSHYATDYDEVSGLYTVTLRDANPGGSADPFGTFFSGVATGNPAAVADGTYTITASDVSENARAIGTFIIDTQVVTGTLDITTLTDSGANDLLTSNGRPILTFAGEAGLTITLKGPDDTTLAPSQYAVRYAAGTYTVLLLDAKFGSGGTNDPFGTNANGAPTGNGDGAIDGTYTILARDPAANTKTVGTFEIDTTAPLVIVSGIDISQDTGASADDFITREASQTISADLSRALIAGEKLWGSIDGGRTWTDATGAVSGTAVSWQASLTGSNAIRFRVSDSALNTSAAASQAFVVDNAAITNKVTGIRISQDTGLSAADFITSVADQTITARLAAALARDERLYGSLDGGGSWLDVTAMASGRTINWQGATLQDGSSNSIRFYIGDTAGNQSTTAIQTYRLDAPLAAGLAITNLALSSDTGSSTTDFITSARSQTISAVLSDVLPAGNRLLGSLDNGTTWVDITAKVRGTAVTWNAATLLTGAGREIQLKVVDIAGNSNGSASQTYLLDTTAPTVSARVTAISADTGTLADWITETASQTISAALTGALPSGERLFASLDGGKAWTDVTGQVTGTSLEWSGQTLTAGANTLLLRVQDTAGNFGATTTRSITLQTSAALTATSASKAEGTTGLTTPFTFTVTLASAAQADLVFNWAVRGVGTNAATASDFGTGTSSQLPSGQITIARGATTGVITVPVLADSSFAQDQDFSVTISSSSRDGRVVITTATAFGKIWNDDALFGTSASDRLSGSGSGEFIYGKAGRDTISGGLGSDHFVFDTAPNARTNVDTITDFMPGADHLAFAVSVYTGLAGLTTSEALTAAFLSAPGATSARDADDRLIYNAATGALYYDPDGTGALAATQIAQLGTSSFPQLSADDILIMA